MIAYRYKNLGFLLLLCGIVLTTVYFTHRIDISVPVFAVFSSYLEHRYFTLIRTNILEELIFIFFLSGFLLTIFSEEKTEHQEYARLRSESWPPAILLNSALLGFFILFVYGAGFAGVLIVNLFSTLAIYHVVFLIKKQKLDRQIKQNIPRD